nr:RNA-directed DNA polymerase, eukaryota, reverse transcriptase zinc-binding domain protein [Tanacetum cinerariifolium]
LKINLCKSKIMGVNVEGSYVNQTAVKLGCQVLTSPFIYLGTKVGGTMSWVQAWQEVVEKVKTRLSKWKMKTLSIGGRFFNGHEIGSKKVSWVKWNNVLTDKKSGGLGVSSLYALNRGLMIKWLWKLFVHKDSIWTKVITAIHGVNGNVNSSGGKAGRSCWLSIVDEVRALHKKAEEKLADHAGYLLWMKFGLFIKKIDGSRAVLKDLFPQMFALENMKEVTVSSKLNGDNLADFFRRNP